MKVSARSCRLKFIQCGPDCIAKGCTAKCCDAPTSPTGIRVYASPAEARQLTRHGIKTVRGMIQPKPGCRVCPAKTEAHLCGLWQQPARPFGCIASPFMLNKNGTLVVRNRYKLLPCYDKERGKPAYVTFCGSLFAIFGQVKTWALVNHLEQGGDDIYLSMDDRIHRKLVGREKALADKS